MRDNLPYAPFFFIVQSFLHFGKHNVYLYTFFSTFTITDAVWFLHSMQRLNDLISSDRRATLISVDSMAYSLLMIPASPVLGWLGT